MKYLPPARRLAVFLLVMAALLAESRAQTSQLVYSQNFNSAAAGTTGTGLNDGSNIVDNSGSFDSKVYNSSSWGSLSAGQQWQALFMTPMSTGIVSNFFMPVTNTGQYVSSFTANCSLLINYINRTTETMADGFSINFGKFNNTTSAYGGETGMYSSSDGKTGDVLTVSWYTYTGATPHIEARYNGSTIATSSQAPFWNNQNPPPNTAFLPVSFSWGTNGLSLTYNGISIFSNLAVPGFSPGVGYSFAMAARTGSAYENLFVDDISIRTTVAPFVWSGGSGNWTTGGNWTVGTAPTTNNNWIVMAGAGGNSNNNAVSAMEGLVFSSNATGSYVLSGNAFTNGADGIVNNSTSTQTVASNITLGAAQTFRAANGGLTFNGTINAGNYTLTVNGGNAVAINGAISGTGASLAKSDAGTLTLGGNNTYTGGTTVSGGRLVGTTASLQGGIVNNATVEFSQSTNGTYSGNMSGTGSLAKSGAGTVTLGGSNSYSGGTTVSGGKLVGTTANLLGAISNNASVEFDQATNGTYSGNMSGSGLLIKSGNSTITLSGSNTHSGGTTISGGKLVAGTANLQGHITNNGDFEISQNTTGTYTGNISGSGSFTKSGTGTVTLNGTNSYSGGTTVSAGRLVGTTASLQGGIANNAAVEFSQATNGSYLGNMTGTGSLTKSGSGTVTLGGTNSYSGGTTVSAGKLAGTTASLQGAIANNASVEFDQATNGTYSGTMEGTGTLTKSGAGKLVMSGTSTYTGATTVEAGQLTVNGALSSTATVQSGASIGGSGRVGGLILNSGSTLTPGNSPGTLSVNGDATWNAGANYNWQVYATNTDPAVQTAAGTGWDYIDVNGTLTLGLDSTNRFNLNLWSLSGTGPDTNGTIPGWNPNVGSTWLIASAGNGIYNGDSLLSANTDYTSLFNINTAATNGAAGWQGALTNGGFQVVTLGDTNNLYLRAVVNSDPSAVPEPGQVAASILLLAGLGGYAWMKRRKAKATA